MGFLGGRTKSGHHASISVGKCIMSSNSNNVYKSPQPYKAVHKRSLSLLIMINSWHITSLYVEADAHVPCSLKHFVSACGNYFGIPLLMQKRRSGGVLDDLSGRTLTSWYPAMLAMLSQLEGQRSNAFCIFGTIEINCLLLL